MYNPKSKDFFLSELDFCFSGGIMQVNHQAVSSNQQTTDATAMETPLNTSAHQTIGTAEQARLSVRQYFNDLRDTIHQQEVEALSVINTHVREKLHSLRQQQEDMAVLITQVSNVCGQCDRALKRSDAEVKTNLILLIIY